MNAFLLTAAGLSLLLMTALVQAEPQGNAPADMKLTDDQCITLWKQAATGQPDGETIPAAAAAPYVKDLSKADTDKDGKVSTKEWADACKGGVVTSAPAAAPEQKKTP